MENYKQPTTQSRIIEAMNLMFRKYPITGGRFEVYESEDTFPFRYYIDFINNLTGTFEPSVERNDSVFFTDSLDELREGYKVIAKFYPQYKIISKIKK